MCPPDLTVAEEAEAYKILEQASRVLGIKNGPVKADFILSSTGFVLLELAPRFHGDAFTVRCVPEAYNINPIRAWFAYLVGGNPGDHLRGRPSGKVAGWR